MQIFLEQTCEENVFSSSLMLVIHNEDTTFFIVENKQFFLKL